jgi:membrane-bound lytic murein transglycosylase D
MQLKAGSTILVPRPETAAEKDISPELVDNATIGFEPEMPESRRISIKVGRHDTLGSIANRHHVSVAQIKSWNNLRHDTIRAGQTLQLRVQYKAAHSVVHRRVAAPHRAPRKVATSSRSRKHHK